MKIAEKKRILARYIETLVLQGIDIRDLVGVPLNRFDYQVMEQEIKEFELKNGIEI